MHELSIAMSMVETAREEAERRGVQVTAVHLRLGALSGVVKDALFFLTKWPARIRHSQARVARKTIF
jgi:Zn finger protein HypA/HybF involved in hydrogenase expression